MTWHFWPKRECTFVDTPKGILTDSGILYRTREHLVQQYAGAVLEHEPLGRLLARSDVWMRSAQSLAVWLLPILLYWRSALEAGLITVALYMVWTLVGPSLVSRTAAPLMRVLDAVSLQALWYVGWLSRAASDGAYTALIIGLAGFVSLRWGLIAFLARPLVNRLWGAMYRLPVPDHILRAYIIRAALHYSITLSDFAHMEQEVADTLRRRTRKHGR